MIGAPPFAKSCVLLMAMPMVPYGSFIDLQQGTSVDGFQQVIIDVDNRALDVHHCIMQVLVDDEPIVATKSISLTGPGFYTWDFATPWIVPQTQTYGLRVCGVRSDGSLLPATFNFSAKVDAQ